jgi:uncharacterized ferritin-like protein (DUF455 family)
MELRQRALQALCVTDPARKAAQARELWEQVASLSIAQRAPAPDAQVQLPGRPHRPELIHPSQVPRRSPFRTREDVVARMALVPRTLEARGLDATPLIQEKLRRVGTPAARRAVDILDIIRDEIGHVAIGNRWYRWLCEREGLDPVAHFRVLARRHEAPRLHPPFNEKARRQAGFSDEELASMGAGPS